MINARGQGQPLRHKYRGLQRPTVASNPYGSIAAPPRSWPSNKIKKVEVPSIPSSGWRPLEDRREIFPPTSGRRTRATTLRRRPRGRANCALQAERNRPRRNEPLAPGGASRPALAVKATAPTGGAGLRAERDPMRPQAQHSRAVLPLAEAPARAPMPAAPRAGAPAPLLRRKRRTAPT